MSTALEHPQFDEASARGLTDEVKADAAALWAKLLDLYEGGAHLALGYASWGIYYEAEFGGSKSAAYRILDAARVVPQLGTAPVPRSESVARELAPLRAEPEQMREAWSEAVEQHGPEPTAAQVREIVRRPEVVDADPAESFFANGMKAERERKSQLYRVHDAAAPCRRIDWDEFSSQATVFNALDRKTLESYAGVLENTARQVRALLKTKLEVVK